MIEITILRFFFIISPWCVDTIWQAFIRHSDSKLRYAWDSFRGICVKNSTYDFVDNLSSITKKGSKILFKTVLKLLFLFPLFGLSFRLNSNGIFKIFHVSDGVIRRLFFSSIVCEFAVFVCLRSITYLNLHWIFASAVVFISSWWTCFLLPVHMYKKIRRQIETAYIKKPIRVCKWLLCCYQWISFVYRLRI